MIQFFSFTLSAFIFYMFIQINKKRWAKQSGENPIKQQVSKFGSELQEKGFNWDQIDIKEAGHFPFLLMGLMAHMIGVDKKVHTNEQLFGDKAIERLINIMPDMENSNSPLPFKVIFGQGVDKKKLIDDLRNIFNNMLSSEIPINKLLIQANSHLAIETKRNILRLMAQLMYADSNLDKAEIKELEFMADTFGLAEDKELQAFRAKLSNEQTTIVSPLNLEPDIPVADAKLTGNLKDIRFAERLFSPNSIESLWDNSQLDNRDNAGENAILEAQESSFNKFMSSALSLQLEDKLEKLKDKRSYLQYLQMGNKLNRFEQILEEKLESGEITYQKYKGLFKTVYSMTMANFNQMFISQRLLESIGKDKLEADISAAKDLGDKMRLDKLNKRLDRLLEEKQKFDELYVLNERAIQEMEEVSIELSRLKGTSADEAQLIDEAMKEMNLLKDRIELFNK